MLRAGAEHWFESAERELRVEGHVAYDDGLVRYRVEGDPDILCVDRLAGGLQERALGKIDPAALELRDGKAVYLGAEFTPGRRVFRSRAAAEGDITGLPAALDEIEYARPGAKSLLRIEAEGGALWLLATRARAGRSPGKAANYRRNEWGSFAVYLYAGSALLHAGLTPASDNYRFWAGDIKLLAAGELVAVHAGALAAGLRQGGDGENFKSMLIMLGAAFLWGTGISLLLAPSLTGLLYFGLLISRIWGGLSASGEQLKDFGLRSGIAALVFPLAAIGPGVIYKSERVLMGGMGVYFYALAAVEAWLLLKASSASSSP
jgi:hypothetical protein